MITTVRRSPGASAEAATDRGHPPQRLSALTAVRRGERSVTAPASMRAELVSLRVFTGRLAGVRLRLGTPR